MQGDAPAIARSNVFDLQDIDQKIAQLIGARRKLARARLARRVVFEEVGVKHFDHAGARARRRDDVLTIGEDIEKARRELAGLGAITAIEGRLAAAGLRFRKVDLDAQPSEQFNHADADLRKELVNQTGDEERYVHSGLAICRRHHNTTAGCVVAAGLSIIASARHSLPYIKSISRGS